MAEQPLPKPDAPSRLTALDDRRRNVRMSMGDRTYSAFVKRLRLFLPFMAIGIVAALLIWPKIEMEISERRFAPSQLDKNALQQAATENRLLNANFSSTDSKGRPFSLVATEAIQENATPDQIVLQNPNGKMQISDTETMTAVSKNGIYAQEAQHLTLNDDVVLTRSDGTTMKTQTLFVDIKSNDTKTDVPVVIEGPDGKLTAQGMFTQKGGMLTTFVGPAKLILNSKDNTTSTTTGGS